jgi:phenylalanyl-tRNA synthetase beta subunit
VVRILRGLGLDVSPGADGWDTIAPTFRVDLLREADLIEEAGTALRLRQARRDVSGDDSSRRPRRIRESRGINWCGES